MEKLKKRSTAMLKKLGKSFRKNFPVVILGILLCFLVRFMFGRANVVTALVSIIGIRELYGTTIKLTNYMRYGITLLAVVLLGTLSTITLPAPTMAFLPIETPGKIVTLPPIQALSPIEIGKAC